MNANDEVQMEGLLRRVVQTVPSDDSENNLWPLMQKRLEGADRKFAWFDWAIAVGLLAAVAAFPSGIPVLLYYL